MSTEASPTSSPSKGDEGNEDDQNGTYECNICLETANSPVVSMCGHLFCWPCLYQWLETRPNRQTCPVCKAGNSEDKVIPIYGRGNPKPQDPREKLSPRPADQRFESESSNPFQNFGFGTDGNFQFSFGTGAFPFGIFVSTFNFNECKPGPPPANSHQQAEEQFLSKVCLWVAFIFFFLASHSTKRSPEALNIMKYFFRSFALRIFPAWSFLLTYNY